MPCRRFNISSSSPVTEMKFNSSAGIEFLSEKSYSPGVIEIAVAGLTLQGQGHFFTPS